jgi:imidazolonepropionase-like amidohydrolase
MAAADTAWWQGRARQLAPVLTPSDLAVIKKYFQHEIEIAGAMHRAGVGVLAGTDVSNPWVYWGFSLHDELANLVAAGFSPMAALQAATIEPARFLHATDSLGTIATGKVGDLVILDADPLADIHNTTRINAVVVRGRLVDSAARQRLLSGAAAAAKTM